MLFPDKHFYRMSIFEILDKRNLSPPHCSSLLPLASAGWGEMPTVHTKTEASWGEPSSPSAAVDNGTSAWGKPPSSGTGWGENPAESAGTYGRTNAPAAAPALCKPGMCVDVTVVRGWRKKAKCVCASIFRQHFWFSVHLNQRLS